MVEMYFEQQPVKVMIDIGSISNLMDLELFRQLYPNKQLGQPEKVTPLTGFKKGMATVWPEGYAYIHVYAGGTTVKMLFFWVISELSHPVIAGEKLMDAFRTGFLYSRRRTATIEGKPVRKRHHYEPNTWVGITVEALML